MASLSRLGKSDLRTLWINRGPNDRRSVRVGRMSDRAADRFLEKVEAIEAAQRLNQSIDPQLAGWVADLPDDMHDRLARVELVAPRAPKINAPTLDEHCTLYIDRRRSEIKPRSIALLEQTRDRLCAHIGCKTRIDAIGPDDAAGWRASMLDKGASEATVRLHTRNAKAMLSAAVEWELIDRNPFAKLRSQSVAANRDRHVSEAEAVRVLEALPDARWRVLFALARFGGLRVPSETHGLTWDRIDWERHRMTVYAPKAHRRGRSADEACRVVPIVPRLYEALRAAYEAAEPGSVRVVDLSRNNLPRTIKAAAKRASVPAWPHLFQTLRRSCETDWATEHPQHAVSAWLGHSEAVSHRHYLQVTDDMIDRAAGRSSRARSAPETPAENNGETTHGASVEGEACSALQNALHTGAETGGIERRPSEPADLLDRVTAAVCRSLQLAANGPARIRTGDRAIMSRLL